MTMFEIFCCGYALQVAGLPFFKRLKMTKFVCSSLRHIKRFCSSLQVSFACVVFRSSLQEFGKAKFVASHKKQTNACCVACHCEATKSLWQSTKAKNSAFFNVLLNSNFQIFRIFIKIFKFLISLLKFFVFFRSFA